MPWKHARLEEKEGEGGGAPRLDAAACRWTWTSLATAQGPVNAQRPQRPAQVVRSSFRSPEIRAATPPASGQRRMDREADDVFVLRCSVKLPVIRHMDRMSPEVLVSMGRGEGKVKTGRLAARG